ncbi:MAG: phosphate acyltransferase PlsX [Lachnospiraceae bacterium]|nr:phosphate acyltransferase PlsX [Lachnospiraceae bacterium]
MGGDFAPAEQVKGAVEAVNENPNVCVKLFGIEEKVNAELSKYTYKQEQIEVIHTPTVIENAESPVKAIKTKKDSSMVTAMYAVKNGEADALVSCGSTGALLVGGQVIVGRIRGIERGALAFMVPTLKGMTLIIDCGANVDARADMLVQFAQMGSIYMECMLGIKNPSVGIINIGEEEEKGNALVKETFPLLKECKGINFVGSVEGRGIPEGEVDVAVCDAFTGNVFLKTYEGVSTTLVTKIKGSLMTSLKTKIGGLLIKKDLKNMLKAFSTESYGGAPMLGLKNLVVKPHGSSKSVEIKNAILQCVSVAEADISAKIAANLELNKEAVEA